MTAERYRIDDLARLAGATVRNVRAYQDRGLLPPPDKEGRIGWYSDFHLARLRLIAELLSRGYTLNNIAELIDSWATGQDLSDLLGLERALIAPWDTSGSTSFGAEELVELLGPIGPEYLDEAVATGLIGRDGDRYRVANRVIEGAQVLVEAGVPIEAVMVLGATIATATDHVAEQYVATITENLLGDPSQVLAPEEMRRLSEIVMRLRPLATAVVNATLASALERRIGAEVGSRFPHEEPVTPGITAPS